MKNEKECVKQKNQFKYKKEMKKNGNKTKRLQRTGEERERESKQTLKIDLLYNGGMVFLLLFL